MMDIVKRLRDPVNNFNSGGRFEAADEIERLRERSEIQKQTAKLAGEEIERLRKVDKLACERAVYWEDMYRAQIPDQEALKIVLVAAEAWDNHRKANGIASFTIENSIAKLRGE